MRSESNEATLTSPSRPKTGRGQRKSSSLPAETVEYLKAWMMSPEHIAHPYPTEQEKAQIMVDTGIELKQLTNWFVNNRKRYWKPRVEARIQHQTHDAAPTVVVQPDVTAALPKACPVLVPVSPETIAKPDLNITASSLVHFDLPRTVSQNSFVGSEISKALSRNDSATSLHLICEGSSTGSAVDEGGDASSFVENSDDYTTESFSKADDDCFLPVSETETLEQSTGQISSQVSPPSTPSKKRLIIDRMQDLHDPVATPRKKFRRLSMETWRDACQEASDVYCESLPTLEEAVKLFGYAT